MVKFFTKYRNAHQIMTKISFKTGSKKIRKIRPFRRNLHLYTKYQFLRFKTSQYFKKARKELFLEIGWNFLKIMFWLITIPFGTYTIISVILGIPWPYSLILSSIISFTLCTDYLLKAFNKIG